MERLSSKKFIDNFKQFEIQGSHVFGGVTPTCKGDDCDILKKNGTGFCDEDVEVTTCSNTTGKDTQCPEANLG